MQKAQTMRRLAQELTDTLRVIAYADTTEAFIRERQQDFRREYGSLIPEEGMHPRGNIPDAYLRFMGILEEEPEEIGRTAEDILYDCLVKYM